MYATILIFYILNCCGVLINNVMCMDDPQMYVDCLYLECLKNDDLKKKKTLGSHVFY